MNQPLVSIIIPYYNKKDTISRSVNSVLAQSYQNWELIIIDDCGVEKLEIDQTPNDKRISIIYNDINLGAAKTRQRGLNISKGEFIAFLDADDWWEVFFLQKCIEKLKSNHICDGVYVKTMVIFANGTKILRRYSNLNLYKIRETIIESARPWQTSAILWRKSSTGDWGSLKTYEDGWFEINSAKYNRLLPIDYIGNNLDRTKVNTLSFIDYTQLNQQLLYIYIYKEFKNKLKLKYKIILYHRLLRGQLKIIQNYPEESIIMGQHLLQLNNLLFFMRNNLFLLKIIHKILQNTAFKIHY